MLDPLEDEAAPAEEGERFVFEDALQEGASGLQRLVWLVLGYDFAPQLVNLSYENVEGLINGGGLTGKGPGVIELTYADGTSNNGIYVLYLQVQRIP